MVENNLKITYIIQNIFFILFFLLDNIKGIEEVIRSKFNDFITISENQKFIIKTNELSIAYFDSIDQNSIIYLRNEYEKEYVERIEGEFLTIYEKEYYYIKNVLYSSETPSIFQRYLFPLDLSQKEIYIENNEISHLYLVKNKNFNLNFQRNSITKIITLSRKTLDAKIIITKNKEKFELNRNNLYYKIPSDFRGKLLLQTNEYDAFIQFLSSPDENESHGFILAKSSFNNYKIDFMKSTLYIPYTQKEIEIQLFSSEPFKFSFSSGYSLSISDSWYYYNSNDNYKIDCPKNKDKKYRTSIKLYNIYRNITLVNNEYFSFTIDVDFNKKRDIYINYKLSSKIDGLIDEEISEVFCNNVIKNLQNLFEIYVYTDIAKNPPQIEGHPNYHHEKINIQESLAKISTKNRHFYEFYQDIETILGAVKDGHLNVISTKTPKGIKISQYSASLPFNFIIKGYESQYRIFIKKNGYYDKLKNKIIKGFIDSHLNLPIKSINKIDPFDYIQNWSRFRGLRNKHAQFSKRLSDISHFILSTFPLNYTEMSLNEYEFEDGQIIRIPYSFDSPTKSNLKFDNYFLNFLKNAENFDEIPSMDKIQNNYLIFLGQKKKNLNLFAKTNINWNPDLSHEEGQKAIKCRVDDINQVNVIYQNSFHFNSVNIVIAKMIKCVKLFYTNNYPIIIIESKNGGGAVKLYTILLQILQPRIEFTDYKSYRITPISEQYFKKRYIKGHIDTYDCRVLNRYQDIKKFYEDSYGDKSIHHNRTSPMDVLGKVYRLALRELREELFKNKKINLKNPTDIIIFTDSFSYSATSGFIKGFQNTGSAVTVGFLGNPKIKGTDLFDASQSPATVDKLKGTHIKNELNKNNFKIIGVTILESYNFHQKNINDQIPREYAFDPVDFRSNIYSDYSDDKYDLFIKEGKKIHEMLTKKNQCNSKNDKLLLHNDNCIKIENDEHAHGGNKCSDTNTWNTDKCEPYYCDIGYYFDQIQKKCIENCKFDDEKSIFIYEDDNLQIFDIKKNIKYHFIFLYYLERKYFYKIKISNGETRIKPVTSEVITINKVDFDRKIEIKEFKTKLNLINLDNTNSKYSFFKTGESLIFIESSKDYVLYLDNIYKSRKTKIQKAKYNDYMTYDEILKHDSKYFSDFDKNIQKFSKDEVCLLYVNLPELDPFNIFMNPIYEAQTIEIKNIKPEFLYLERYNTYILDFKNNKINRMMKLSRETIKAEINITNPDSPYNHVILDASELYYEIRDDFKGKLQLYVDYNDALIEFLFKQDNLEIEVLNIDDKVMTLNKRYNILPIPLEYKSKQIEIELTRNEEESRFSIYLAYTIPPYNFFSINTEGNSFRTEKFSFKINEHYEGNINLMDDEYYCVMIENFEEDVTLEIKNYNKISNSMKLEGWKISLLVGLLIIAL